MFEFFASDFDGTVFGFKNLAFIPINLDDGTETKVRKNVSSCACSDDDAVRL